MAQFLVSIHRPDNYDPALAEDEAMRKGIDALNDEMITAGVRVFVGGLHSAREAESINFQTNGELQSLKGPYLKTKEHVGGFWVLKVANMKEALVWGHKAALACRASVEVREFH